MEAILDLKQRRNAVILAHTIRHRRSSTASPTSWGTVWRLAARRCRLKRTSLRSRISRPKQLIPTCTQAVRWRTSSLLRTCVGCASASQTADSHLCHTSAAVKAEPDIYHTSGIGQWWDLSACHVPSCAVRSTAPAGGERQCDPRPCQRLTSYPTFPKSGVDISLGQSVACWQGRAWLDVDLRNFRRDTVS